MPVEKHVPHTWLILVFFASITATFHFLSVKASKARPAVIIRFFMSTTAIRLFLYMLLILAYRFYDKTSFIPFTVGFMMHYFLFTVFEVPVLLSELKKS
jgi:hypothetical protein